MRAKDGSEPYAVFLCSLLFVLSHKLEVIILISIEGPRR